MKGEHPFGWGLDFISSWKWALTPFSSALVEHIGCLLLEEALASLSWWVCPGGSVPAAPQSEAEMIQHRSHQPALAPSQGPLCPQAPGRGAVMRGIERMRQQM